MDSDSPIHIETHILPNGVTFEGMIAVIITNEYGEYEF